MDIFIETLKSILIYGVVIFLMFFIPFWLLIKAMGKRTKEMRIEAEKLGFNFTLSGDGSVLESLKDFFLVNSANINYSEERNIFKKQQNSTDITLADLCLRSSKYRTKHETATSLTVLYFKSKDLILPEFYMKPEQMLDKATYKFDYKKIDFMDHPDFSKTYLLYGKDENGVRNLFNKSGIIIYLEQEKELCIEGNGQCLIICRCINGAPCIIETAELNTFINRGQQIFSMFSK